MFECFNVTDQLLVMLEKARTLGKVFMHLPIDQSTANKKFARQLGVLRAVMDTPLGVEQDAVQRGTLPRHDLPRVLFPVRLIGMTTHQMRPNLLQPFWLDLGNRARKQTGGIDQLAGHDPAPCFLLQR